MSYSMYSFALVDTETDTFVEIYGPVAGMPRPCLAEDQAFDNFSHASYERLGWVADALNAVTLSGIRSLDVQTRRNTHQDFRDDEKRGLVTLAYRGRDFVHTLPGGVL